MKKRLTTNHTNQHERQQDFKQKVRVVSMVRGKKRFKCL